MNNTEHSDDEVKADRIVKAILNDLRDRSGLDQAWDGIDRQVRAEILVEWRQLVIGVLKVYKVDGLTDVIAAARAAVESPKGGRFSEVSAALTALRGALVAAGFATAPEADE